MKFIIFHGSFGSPEENWFPELKEQLESLGQKVLAPQFPVDDWDKMVKDGPSVPLKNQNLQSWLFAFDSYMAKINENEKLCFIGHSLGCVFILHLIQKYNIKLDCAIFVSPFLNRLKKWEFNHANHTFYKSDFDFAQLKKLISISYVLYSDSDPYVDNRLSLDFAHNLDSSPIFIKKAGHMNSAVNLNEFPLVFELCKTRIDLSLYQRYLTHRKDLYSVNYAKNKSEEVIYLKSEEIFDEGRFHFRNLKHKGFCTFYTGIRDWNVYGKYYEDARSAAKSVKDFTRVFILDKMSDLKRKTLAEQIKLDMAAGIKTYICLASDIKDKIPEMDFGIWDNDYVCIVHSDKGKVINEVILDSRSEEMKQARQWEKIILAHATRYTSAP